MLLQPNTTFDNHYTLIRQLGRGGFSEVWLAHDSYMDIDVAIKIYAPGQGMDSNSINEFRREITGVFQLNHPNLLCPKHLGIWENMPYLIMAYCPAGSCLKFVGNISESEIWHLIHDVAAGLAYLHEKDIVHQDIKPDNILIDTEGNYLITDFGISARARSTLRKSVIGGNTSGGTTAYMGPERFSRQPAPTKASDIWSFGAMAFELLEGVTPFGEIGGGMQKGGAEIPFINAPVSDALKYTIFKMLSKETWDRPTAATLIEWANNPNAIEVDYDLLTDNNDTTSPTPAPAPLINEATTGLETQRIGCSESAAILDENSSIQADKQNDVKIDTDKNQTSVVEKLMYILTCCYGLVIFFILLGEVNDDIRGVVRYYGLNRGIVYAWDYIYMLFILLYNSITAIIELNKKLNNRIKQRFAETSILNLFLFVTSLAGVVCLDMDSDVTGWCLPVVIMMFILQLIKSKRFTHSSMSCVAKEQTKKDNFKNILIYVACIALPFLGAIKNGVIFTITSTLSIFALILYLRMRKKHDTKKLV